MLSATTDNFFEIPSVFFHFKSFLSMEKLAAEFETFKLKLTLKSGSGEEEIETSFSNYYIYRPGPDSCRDRGPDLGLESVPDLEERPEPESLSEPGPDSSPESGSEPEQG